MSDLSNGNGNSLLPVYLARFLPAGPFFWLFLYVRGAFFVRLLTAVRVIWFSDAHVFFFLFFYFNISPPRPFLGAAG